MLLYGSETGSECSVHFRIWSNRSLRMGHGGRGRGFLQRGCGTPLWIATGSECSAHFRMEKSSSKNGVIGGWRRGLSRERMRFCCGTQCNRLGTPCTFQNVTTKNCSVSLPLSCLSRPRPVRPTIPERCRLAPGRNGTTTHSNITNAEGQTAPKGLLFLSLSHVLTV